jgi:hypothetical protein
VSLEDTTMPVDVTRTLREALSQLQSERDRIDRQMRSIRSVLGGARDSRGSAGATGGGRRRRRRMSAAARRAVSQRMKAYWASRRAAKQGGRGRGKTAKAAS